MYINVVTEFLTQNNLINFRDFVKIRISDAHKKLGNVKSITPLRIKKIKKRLSFENIFETDTVVISKNFIHGAAAIYKNN